MQTVLREARKSSILVHCRANQWTGVYKNFAIFTGKHLCWSLFLIKLQASRPETLLEIDSNAGVFL